MPHPDRTPDDAATQQYESLVRSARREWDELEESGDPAASLSQRARASIREAVRADSRRGAQVHLPATPAGPVTISESGLRALVRSAVDTLPGAVALRSTAEYADRSPDRGVRGLPVRLRVRISAAWSTPDLRILADRVRDAVLRSCHEELGLDDVIVDVHIEDLHEH